MTQRGIMHFFLQWPWTCKNDWVKIMTHPRVISNLYEKKELPMCLHKKGLWSFSSIDLELAKMTLNQNHDTPLGVSILISLSKFKKKICVKLWTLTEVMIWLRCVMKEILNVYQYLNIPRYLYALCCHYCSRIYGSNKMRST